MAVPATGDFQKDTWPTLVKVGQTPSESNTEEEQKNKKSYINSVFSTAAVAAAYGS